MDSKRVKIFLAENFLKYLIVFLALFQANIIAENYSIPGNSLNNIKFKNISIQDGLSQVTVLSIKQDSKGFLWIGTREGLNKYDGYEFTYFKQRPDDESPLLSNYVSAIFSDSRNYLWIGTDNGLNRYSYDKNHFISYSHKIPGASPLNSNRILAIYEDREKNLWLGTSNGLKKYIPEKDSFIDIVFPGLTEQSQPIHVESIQQIFEDKLIVGTSAGLFELAEEELVPYRFKTGTARKSRLLNRHVKSLLVDSKNKVWIGTLDGLLIIDPVNGDMFEHAKSASNDPIRLASNQINALFRDRKGNIWIGTEDGLTIYNESKKYSEIFRADKNIQNAIADNVINTIVEDETGVIWIGTDGGGLSSFDWSLKKFNGFGIVDKSSSGLSDGFIYGICAGQDNDLWLSTNNGLNRYNLKTKKFVHYYANENKSGTLSNNKVRALRCDATGNIWIGTYGGLNIYDPEKNNFTVLKNIPGKENSLSDNLIASIFIESAQKVWLGTMNGGLNLYNPEKNSFKIYRHEPDNPQSISNDEIRTIVKGDSGFFWIGTYGGGLCHFDPQTGTFKKYINIPGDYSSISSNYIYSVHISKDGMLWIGTYGGGLNRFDPGTKEFNRYSMEDGLPNDVIYGILEDNKGKLWLSTNNGLSRFDPQLLDENRRATRATVQNFNIADGLQSTEFNFGAYFQNSSGEMFFGSINGFNCFHPDSIRSNPYIPPVEITGVTVLNKRITAGENTKFEKHLSGEEKLVLSYDDYTFSIKFAALHYSNPQRNRYAYKLEGIDPDWVYTDANNRSASYTTIEGGEYIFKVMAANNDGLWNNIPRQLIIEIVPAFWQATWFRFLLVLAIIFSSVSFHRNRTNNIKKRRDELEKINIKLHEQILERKNAQIALKQSEEKHRGLTENLSVGIFRTNAEIEGTYIEINPALIRMLGFSSKEEALKYKVRDVYQNPEDRRAFVEKIWNKGFVKDEEICLKKRNGEVIVCSITAVSVRDISGKPLYFDGVVEDITEKKKVEQALIESEGKYRNFVERASDGILIVQDEVVKYTNPKLAEMADLPAAKILGLKFIDFVHPDERDNVINRHKKRMMGEKVENIYETILIGKNGNEIFAEINIGAITFEGKTAHLIMVRDISERRHLEEQIRQVQKMEAIGMLAGGVAHDFNNILTIINGHAELVLMKIKEDDPNYNLIKEIQKSGHRATNLTRQLLAFSRKQIIEPQILNINGVIANMDKMLRRLIGEDITMKLILTPDLPRLKADPGQFEQVMMNLVINGRDAIHENPDNTKPKFISIETKAVDVGEKKIGKFAKLIPGKYVQISVSDTGQGIDKSFQEKIFDPFFTTKETGKGTGLGLSTVFGIIKQNKGYIEVDSKVGRGSTFKIYWPVVDSEIIETEYIDTRIKKNLGTEKILLVEDDEGVRQFASIAMQESGYSVVEFENGKEALEYADTEKPEIDMMITDMVMPEMNGKELADKIKKKYPKIQILYTSGYTDLDIVRNGTIIKGINFLQKPYSANTLLTKIREILDN